MAESTQEKETERVATYLTFLFLYKGVIHLGRIFLKMSFIVVMQSIVCLKSAGRVDYQLHPSR